MYKYILNIIMNKCRFLIYNTTNILFLKLSLEYYLRMDKNQSTKTQSQHILPLQDKINEPFTILKINHAHNQFFHKSNIEIEHLQNNHKENLKSNSQIQTNDFTIKKVNHMSSCTQSQKTIKESQNIIDLPKVDQINPEFDLIQFSSSLQLHRILHLDVSFAEIKKTFLEESKKMHFSMCQNTSRFATIKKGTLSSCKCIIEIFVRGQINPNVYQIRQNVNNPKKAKLIMIDGDQHKFQQFCIILMKKLAENNFIKLTLRQQTELLLHQKKSGFTKLRQEGQYIINKIRKSSTKGKMEVECKQMVQKACTMLNKINESIRQGNNIDYNSQTERYIESYWFKQLNLPYLFSQLYRDQFQIFHSRRNNILKSNNLYDIFKYLEISQHYNQFRSIKDSKQYKTCESYPYISAIKIINNLQIQQTPTTLLRHMMGFETAIKNCYDRYFLNKIKLADMDDYLPITIFCVLCMDNQQFNLLASVKMLLNYLSHEQQFEEQKKILTNIQAAFDFIIKQWQ